MARKRKDAPEQAHEHSIPLAEREPQQGRPPDQRATIPAGAGEDVLSALRGDPDTLIEIVKEVSDISDTSPMTGAEIEERDEREARAKRHQNAFEEEVFWIIEHRLYRGEDGKQTLDQYLRKTFPDQEHGREWASKLLTKRKADAYLRSKGYSSTQFDGRWTRKLLDHPGLLVATYEEAEQAAVAAATAKLAKAGKKGKKSQAPDAERVKKLSARLKQQIGERNAYYAKLRRTYSDLTDAEIGWLGKLEGNAEVRSIPGDRLKVCL